MALAQMTALRWYTPQKEIDREQWPRSHWGVESPGIARACIDKLDTARGGPGHGNRDRVRQRRLASDVQRQRALGNDMVAVRASGSKRHLQCAVIADNDAEQPR